MIPFNRSPFTGNETTHVQQAMQSGALCGNGNYSRLCQKWFEETLPCRLALLTPSCTHALEMAAILIDTKPGDEIIMPSYTFVSTANAFVLRGAKIVFVDVRPDTMNIDENKIEQAVTEKTKAIIPVHYAGVGCEMDRIMEIAARHNLFVIEDAAQGFMGYYKGQHLGTIGHIGTYSFHETKNYTSGGEGGLLIVNDPQFAERAEIIREKGTNRGLFYRGMVDKYSWVDIGSSYLPGELQAAYLFGQLERVNDIKNERLALWNKYYQGLKPLSDARVVELPIVPKGCEHPAHMFYIKTQSLKARTELMQFLKDNGVQTAFHYVPLHSSKAGMEFGRFSGDDVHTSVESDRLLRLPLWYGLTRENVDEIVQKINEFFMRA